SPDGRWWVLSDRTEAPSGAGYALENRVVTSRCLPDLFANQNVRRHASFFSAFNEHFLASARTDQPFAVFLTRGPSKQTYFEHAYLARYLGLDIVEGSDLTVRDERLFLKSVAGLRPVDLVLRTVRSEMCDPLELRTDSMFGVPGLLKAARAGSVTIANALGSGLVESDAFLSFLPSLSRFLLDEELAMPSVATWWCGQEAERRYVADNLDKLIVRQISTTRSLLSGGRAGRVGQHMSESDRSRLLGTIRQSGHDFVGQEILPLSTAPAWSKDNTVQPAPVLLRIYVAATANGYQLLPGGLTRGSSHFNTQATWLSRGEFSKDTWVLSDEPVETFSILAQADQNLRRAVRELPSRAADNLFWLGRYAERAEAAVRLLRSLVIRLHGETGGTRNIVSQERLVALLVLQKHLSARRARHALHKGRDAVERELWTVLFDPDSKDGLATVLGKVRRTADIVRERLSFDAFRILTDTTNVPELLSNAPNQTTDDALRLLNRLIQYLAAFSGMVMENMTRSYGWRFLDMGRRIERVRSMSQLMQQLATRGDPADDGGLDLLLELADSTMTYRARYHSAPALPRVLDLLLADETNPRSALFQVISIARHLRVLPGSTDGLPGAHQQIVTRIASDFRLADVFQLSSSMSRAGSRARLARLLRHVETGVETLSDEISQKYFSHSAANRVVGVRRRGTV
ncbi:MAG: circularly permuted type 2 ATP-grasp protein, partial [Gammaproteobacteria bacterium]